MNILSKPDRVALRKPSNILRKNPLPTFLFIYYSLKIKFHFVLATKTNKKAERQRAKESQKERSKKIRVSTNFVLSACSGKKNPAYYNYVQLTGKYLLISLAVARGICFGPCATLLHVRCIFIIVKL